MNSNNVTIKFILPGFLNISRNEILINIFEKHRYIIRDNSIIYSFYGNFPGCEWNGGRVCLGEKYKIRKIKNIKKFHNKHGVSIALTMTNLLLDENSLKNKYANKIMKIFNDTTNEVLVSSNLLKSYIEKNYKKIKINRSITATEKKDWEIEGYNLSLLPVRKINDFEFMKKLPISQRRRMEILVNEPCKNNCEYKYTHYSEISNVQKGYFPTSREPLYSVCKKIENSSTYKSFYEMERTSFAVAPNDLKKYLRLGINHFKVNGREKYWASGYIGIVKYFIKEEYQSDVLCFMFERMILEYEKEVIYQTKKYGSYMFECDYHWHERVDVHASR